MYEFELVLERLNGTRMPKFAPYPLMVSQVKDDGIWNVSVCVAVENEDEVVVFDIFDVPLQREGLYEEDVDI